ncbi:hypothetical protein [Roseateles chitosanitabidus]|uniref:hypothetical protein n=1 Tax=Roseateles chitosanitabidus TaxID=65048 RepID=UPI0011E01FAD|nr:hypothetical protein [Roseateles chitosanitabidus]MBO9686306.1 hypothetical protein [Roseateles chitosanitabidus]
MRSYPEARVRTTTSRAYYASYQRCLQWEQSLPAPGAPSRIRGGAHQQLIDRLENPSGQCSKSQREKSRELAKLLLRQRELRELSDYEMTATVTGPLGTEQMRLTQEVFDYCDGLAHPPASTRTRRRRG